MAGWIKVHRGLLDWKFANKPDYMAVWMNLLLSASHDGYDTAVGNQLVSVKKGQIITGRKRISKETGVQEMKVERILSALVLYQQIEQQTFTKYRLISIVKWDEYQTTEQQSEQQMNNKRTTNEQQMNTIKNDKNVKTIKPSSSSPDEVVPEPDFYLTKKKKKLVGKRLDTFNQFWMAFSYPKGKADAADSWLDIPSLTDAMMERIISAAKITAQKRFALKEAGKTPQMAQGWLSGRRWEDESTDAPVSATASVPDHVRATYERMKAAGEIA